MRYLSAQEILVLHALVVDETGGSHGVRDIGLLQSIAAKPAASFGGADLYPDLFIKAAALLEAIANYHVFIDGNKRTALIAASRFLDLMDMSSRVQIPTLKKSCSKWRPKNVRLNKSPRGSRKTPRAKSARIFS